MKPVFPLLPVLLLGASAVSHAFTLDIADNEVTEFGQGPRSIFAPGYGEIVFESGLDCVLVLDSAYASTARIEVHLPSDESTAEPSLVDTAASTDAGIVKIAHRNLSPSMQATLHPVDAALQNPPGGWNAVPEAASATLGLIGTLMLLLRRRVKTMSRAREKP